MLVNFSMAAPIEAVNKTGLHTRRATIDQVQGVVSSLVSLVKNTEGNK